MVLVNFKTITVVPAGDALVDNVLSKTQRKTPTVVHKGYAIGRIRDFYMRKVKFSQQMFHDKLSQILNDFPKFDELHPFYADLLNVLYDRDHYKLALGQLATARSLIDGIARDYVRLLKYADSLYRCKCLKRAALGRMCTLVSRHKKNLAYLEQVRQHLARLPSIDPATRTLLIAGFPNVGKSSFINKITRADVDVQPYAFTTKSLFVGHCDYKYLRWQVIDTPGILDHELEARNTIEMQSITALAHLRACVLFFVDPSEQCGYSLEKQHSLFKSIMPLFANKPVIVVATKTDLGWESSLEDSSRELLESFKTDSGGKATMLKMSTHEEVGVTEVKNTACEKLLEARVESKVRGKKVQKVLNRLHLATPKTTTEERKPNIPASVLARRAAQSEARDDIEMEDTDVTMGTEGSGPGGRKLERDLQEENGGAGVYSMDWRKLYQLRKKEWAYDIMPEIVDGKNIADFVDPDIGAKLRQLELEEEAREAVRDVTDDAEVGGYRFVTDEERQVVRQIKDRKSLIKQESVREKNAHKHRSALQRNKVVTRRSRLQEHLESLGLEKDEASDLVDRAASRRGVKRTRSQSLAISTVRQESRPRSLSRSRSVSIAPNDGFSNPHQRAKAMELARKKLKTGVAKYARKGDADRSIPSKLPKHLFSGKRGIGKTDRR
ncbi:Nucleolar GTP-binding protein [Gracilaria domingensis]|nr:Nucleolar GTP-binding protein [Gracilaria domingensis]